MASSLVPTADLVAARGAARPKAQVTGPARRSGLVGVFRLAFEVWSEARALQAEAYRRHPFTSW